MKHFTSKSPKVMLLSMLLMALVLVGAVCCFPACKAWRTVTTTATCVQSADSTKTNTTITTKTVEEYQGVKKK